MRPVELFLLRRTNPCDGDEVLRDLDEECARRRAEGASRGATAWWRLRQLAGVSAYGMRDRVAHGGGRRSPSGGMHPALALRLALRGLRHSPGVALAAALTLGLGFGAAAAIYGVYHGFSRPLPVPGGDEVRWIRVLDERGRGVELTRQDLDALATGSPAFAALGGYRTGEVNLSAPGRPVTRTSYAAITPGVAGILGVMPALGRQLDATDLSGVLVSHALWSGYLEGDEGALGEILRVGERDRTLVGVMPEGHRFPFNQDVWWVLDPRDDGALETIARLADGISAQRAAADVDGLLGARRAERDIDSPAVRAEVLGFTAKRGEGGENAALATLLTLVVALVLVSCSNVSNLLFARALGRANLLAVHAALGAGPAQMVLQMFLESLLIALGGALVGLGLAAAAIGYIESTLSGHWGYYWMAVRFDPGVVLFTLALAVVTGVVSGMVPALRLRRADLNEVLKADAGGVIGGSRSRWTSVLLNLQVAFSCLALVISMLMAGALLRSQVADGFRADDVFVAAVTLDGPAYDDAAARRMFHGALQRALASDGEVTAAALSNVVPGLTNSSSPLEVEGVPRDPDARPVSTLTFAVTPEYFDIFGMRVLGGRGLGADESGEAVALVSESFVREHLPNADAVGQRIRLPRLTGDTWLRIVGVVTDVAEYADADARALARVYVPFGAVEPRSHFVVYTGSSGAGAALRGAIAGLDPQIAVSGIFGLGSEMRVADVIAYVARIFKTVGILAVLGGLGAALVAAIGLYGALAFEVQRRRGEIGVRMALGAASDRVARHMITAGLWRVAPGLLLGFVVCAGFSPLLGALLGSMDPRDPFIYLGVYGGYLVVTVLAMLIPARRAARLDPVRVLRKD
jgi:predicted permease